MAAGFSSDARSAAHGHHSETESWRGNGMARVVGFEPARSGQEPADVDGNPVPVGVWGDSNTGVGVFGTTGTLPPDDGNIPATIAGVEGHSGENPGVVGRRQPIVRFGPRCS